jgi:hypothetical protein
MVPLPEHGRIPQFNPLHWITLVSLCVAGSAVGAVVTSHMAAGRAMGADRDTGVPAVLALAAVGAAMKATSMLDGTPLLTPSRMVLFTIAGIAVGVVNYWAQATCAYALATVRLRRADREGAKKAIRRYLTVANQDPLGETRRPIAERFLQDESATLDVPVELEAAASPEGRGTEPEAASSPAGRGTELEGAPHGRPEGRA